jgi:hypothetical protein
VTANESGGFLEPAFRDVAEYEARALLGEALGGEAAEAARRPGDEDGRALVAPLRHDAHGRSLV